MAVSVSPFFNSLLLASLASGLARARRELAFHCLHSVFDAAQIRSVFGAKATSIKKLAGIIPVTPMQCEGSGSQQYGLNHTVNACGFFALPLSDDDERQSRIAAGIPIRFDRSRSTKPTNRFTSLDAFAHFRVTCPIPGVPQPLTILVSMRQRNTWAKSVTVLFSPSGI
jgi:hypothetical protein